MTASVVVKIDLCKSKLFSHEREGDNPEIRKILAQKLQEISVGRFPYSDKKYPQGSFYKAEGDAVYFILEKPTVSIRSAIEFMTEWYQKGIKESFPECRIVIHRGIIDVFQVPGGHDFVGKVFEDISVIEKTLDEGKIYITEEVLRNSDVTISKFVHYGKRQVAPNTYINIYYAAFSDPRTFENDALAHLLFVARKETSEIRRKIFRFFIMEYIMEVGELEDLDAYQQWLKAKGYSVIPKEEVGKLLADTDTFELEQRGGAPIYRLKGEQVAQIKKAQENYKLAVEHALKTVSDEIIKEAGTEKATEGFDLRKIMDEYLCGVFSEIRMMANYFRDTLHFYDTDLKTFERYEYVIDRHLSDLEESLARNWKRGFMRGLKIISQQESIYISAIFHNILAGYYLNRAFQSSPYQLERLQERHIYLDTNILYALQCQASSYHDRVRYFADGLRGIGLHLRVYPFTASEFESSLERVETEYKRDPLSPYLMNWNPWLYQEFRSRPHKYLNNISVCRITYSIAKGSPVTEENYDKIDKELDKINVCLEREYKEFSSEDKKNIWDELRAIILSKSGGMEDYWAVSEKLGASHENIIEHDVNLMENAKQLHLKVGEDELGPKVLLLTTDSKLIKCRRQYPFVITTEQFLEFILPYLFLADIPAQDPNRFPNEILSAQLGVHISYWMPSTNDVVAMCFKHPEFLQNESLWGPGVCSTAKVVSKVRFKKIIEESQTQPEPEKQKAVLAVADAVDKAMETDAEIAFMEKQLKDLKDQLNRERQEKETFKVRTEKLQRTLKYYKGLRRRGP
jgi:hypothetical protein